MGVGGRLGEGRTYRGGGLLELHNCRVSWLMSTGSDSLSYLTMMFLSSNGSLCRGQVSIHAVGM